MKLMIQGMSFDYDNKTILKDLTMEMSSGEFVTILGPSGVGKSTILNILSGVLAAPAGSIFVDNERIQGITPHFSYMPQDDLLFPWRTVLDNVCIYGEIHGLKAALNEQALELFPAFGLAGYETAYPRELSGGMRQRAAFLRTVLCAGDILLLDEPFGALDVITRGEMQDWLLSMRKQLNKTILLVTHDIDEAIYLSDRILILNGTPASVTEELVIDEPDRSREWLYSQGGLRTQIYHEIRGRCDGSL